MILPSPKLLIKMLREKPVEEVMQYLENIEAANRESAMVTALLAGDTLPVSHIDGMPPPLAGTSVAFASTCEPNGTPG